MGVFHTECRRLVLATTTKADYRPTRAKFHTEVQAVRSCDRIHEDAPIMRG